MRQEYTDLKDLFADFDPEVSDGAIFMSRLEKKLEAIEQVRRMQEARVRRYRIATLVAFVVGLVTGGALLAVVMGMPADPLVFTFDTHLSHMLVFELDRRIVALVVFSLLLAAGTVALQNVLMDLSVYSHGKKFPACFPRE